MEIDDSFYGGKEGFLYKKKSNMTPKLSVIWTSTPFCIHMNIEPGPMTGPRNDSIRLCSRDVRADPRPCSRPAGSFSCDAGNSGALLACEVIWIW
jgi:hypothetical protein